MPKPADTSPLDQDKAKRLGQVLPDEFRRDRGRARHISLTARDDEILATLALKVRCLDLRLIVRAWWGEWENGPDAARQRLRLLVDNDWLRVKPAFARPLPELDSPVVTWRPSEQSPAFGSISYYLKTRFRAPARSTQIFFASPQTLRRYGAPKGREPRTSEVTHDLAAR